MSRMLARAPLRQAQDKQPAKMLQPGDRKRIWEIQEPLNFPLTVYGFERSEATMKKITKRLSEMLGSHGSDEPGT